MDVRTRALTSITFHVEEFVSRRFTGGGRSFLKTILKIIGFQSFEIEDGRPFYGYHNEITRRSGYIIFYHYIYLYLEPLYSGFA